MRQSPISDSPLLQQPQQQQQFALTDMVQTQQSQPGTEQQQQQQPNVTKERTTIWQGFVEWDEKQKGPPEGQKIPRQVLCQVTSNVVNGEAEVKFDVWPDKLKVQFIPKGIIDSLGGDYLMDSKTVVFMLQPCEELEILTRELDSGFAGCVKLTGTNMNPGCSIQGLILLHSKERNAYLGFVPNDQPGFLHRIREVVRQRVQQATMRQGQGPNFPVGATPEGPMGPRGGGGMMQQNPGPGGMVAGNLPPGIQAQVQQGNIPHGMQQANITTSMQQQQGSRPIGQGSISSTQQGSVGVTQQGQMIMQAGNIHHGNMPGQMGQSGVQGNIQAGNHPTSMQQQGNMPPGMQHSNMQSMQSAMQPGLQSAAMSQSTLQHTLQQNPQAAALQHTVLQQQLGLQQQQQGGGAGINLAEIELMRRRNLIKIQELQQALEAAQAKELQFQRMEHNSPQPGTNPGGQMSQPRMAASVQRMLRPPGPQGNNPRLHSLLQQPGAPPFNRMMGSVQGNPRMAGQQQQQHQQGDDIITLD